MPFQIKGKNLDWQSTKAAAPQSRRLACRQIIQIYLRERDRQDYVFEWGDEIEYMLVKFDDAARTARVTLTAPEVLQRIRQQELTSTKEIPAFWTHEYVSYVIEGIPLNPYGSKIKDYESVEKNMRQRRRQALAALACDETILTLTSFPRLGCKEFCFPYQVPSAANTQITGSIFLPDSVVSQGYSRYVVATKHTTTRRGEQPSVNVPVFQDVNTKQVDESLDSLPQKPKTSPLSGHIYMDAVGFGMGCCCLQVTLKGRNLSETRMLFDQLAPICPIMLAMTAASPLHRGFISDVDCRWEIISCTSDCRNRQERGLDPFNRSKPIVHKRRYDSICGYISEQAQKYNDVPVTIDEESFDFFRSSGMDASLSRYFANLLSWEPLVLYDGFLQEDDCGTANIEAFIVSNWQSVRLKPPCQNGDPGWRIEFRPCEVQLTDRENAAVACFIALLSRAIISGKMNFLLPISKVDENFRRAQKRDAILDEKFWFRSEVDGVYLEMTINEIFNGKEGEFPGLIPAVRSYIEDYKMDSEIINGYLELISKRAAGELMTNAHWIRDFVTSHPDYKDDSVVSELINYDLLKTIDGIQKSEIICPEILG